MNNNLSKRVLLKVVFGLSLMFLGMGILSSAAHTDNVMDLDNIDGPWSPLNNKYAVYRGIVLGTTTVPSGANVYVGLYGGQLNDLDMNDGCLTLTRDLVLTGQFVNFDDTKSGTITTNTTGLKTVFMSKDQELAGHLTFTGDIGFDCDNHNVNLDNTGTFSVQDGKTLLLTNMSIEGLADTWISLNGLNNNTTVSFDNVVFQDNPYSSYIDNADNPLNIMVFRNDCAFVDGFKLSTTTHLGTKFPVSGTLDLNGYTLSLQSDLVFLDVDALYSPVVGSVAADLDANLRTLFFQRDQLFTGELTLKNNIIIDGNDAVWDLNSLGSFILDSGVTLTLRNMMLKDLHGAWVNDTSRVYFENVTFWDVEDAILAGASPIFMDKDNTLDNDLSITYDLVIDGNGYILNVDGHTLTVTFGNTVFFKNMILTGIDDEWLTLSHLSTFSFDNVQFIDVYGGGANPYSTGFTDPYFFEFVRKDCTFHDGLTLTVDTALATEHPISGALDVHNQSLTLNSDITFAADGYLSDLNRVTIFADTDANNRTIFFNADQKFENVLSFSSDVILDGNTHVIDLNNVGKITVEPGKTLTLKNITLRNLSADWFSGGRLVSGGGMKLID